MTPPTSPDAVRTFLDEYFKAWQGTDKDRIMSYYSKDVILQLPTGELKGHAAVRNNFVHPFILAFPGNIHTPVHVAHAANLVAVEWIFTAVHRGPFAGFPASNQSVKLHGSS